MKIPVAWRTLCLLFTFEAAALVITPQRYNISLAASPSNLTSSNSLLPCCAGLRGGYAFNGAYDASVELIEPNDVYLREVIDLLVPFGATRTVRGNKDLAHLEEYGDVTVSLNWIMDPPGSDTLTYAQSRAALESLVDVINGDITAPKASDHEVLVSISVGNDEKIVVTVTHEDGDTSRAEAGEDLEVISETYRLRPISQRGAAACLGAAQAEYSHHLQPGSQAAAVPEGYAQNIIHGRVRFKLVMELDTGEPDWPHITFVDLMDVLQALFGLLEAAVAPSADRWPALYATIETREGERQEAGITVGSVQIEPVNPGERLLNSGHSNQTTISRPGNSSGVSQVNVT